MKDTGH